MKYNSGTNSQINEKDLRSIFKEIQFFIYVKKKNALENHKDLQTNIVLSLLEDKKGRKRARKFLKRYYGALDIGIREWISRQDCLASLSISFLFPLQCLFNVSSFPFFVLITSFVLSPSPRFSIQDHPLNDHATEQKQRQSILINCFSKSNS